MKHAKFFALKYCNYTGRKLQKIVCTICDQTEQKWKCQDCKIPLCDECKSSSPESSNAKRT